MRADQSHGSRVTAGPNGRISVQTVRDFTFRPTIRLPDSTEIHQQAHQAGDTRKLGGSEGIQNQAATS